MCTELNGRRGFVVAPFEVKQNQPILLIRPDKVDTLPLEAVSSLRLSGTMAGASGIIGGHRMHYSIDFANEHSQLELDTFRKIVLARCADEETDKAIPPMQLFYKACMLYPRMFISLVSTPKSGCWLTATPEILLEGGRDGQWRTIALAGTMTLEGEQLQGEGETLSWSTKNICRPISRWIPLNIIWV